MFVYERNGVICVTFKDNKPVEKPEYEIEIDKEAGKITVNGTECAVASSDDIAPMAASIAVEETPVVTKRTSKKVVAEETASVVEG